MPVAKYKDARQAITERYILSTLPTVYIPFTKDWGMSGSQFLSSDGRGWPCTVTGMLLGQEGGIFDGLDDKISLPTLPVLNSVTKFTIAFSYKRTALGNSRRLCSINVTDNANSIDIFTAKEANGVYCRVSNGALSTGIIPQSDLLGMWYYGIVAYDGAQPTNATKLVSWWNGIQQTLTFADAAIPTSTANNAAFNFIVGGQSTFLDGVMGTFLIYPYTFHTMEAQRLTRLMIGRNH